MNPRNQGSPARLRVADPQLAQRWFLREPKRSLDEPLDLPRAPSAPRDIERRLPRGPLQGRPAAVNDTAARWSVQVARTDCTAPEGIRPEIAVELEEQREVEWPLLAVHQQADEIKCAKTMAGHAVLAAHYRFVCRVGVLVRPSASDLARQLAAFRSKPSGDAYGASGALTNRTRTST